LFNEPTTTSGQQDVPLEPSWKSQQLSANARLPVGLKKRVDASGHLTKAVELCGDMHDDEEIDEIKNRISLF
jgi:hypothetical protein